MITQKTVQEVMNIARVEDVIGDFINLKRRGVNMIGNCPFHDEKTPSFTVSPSKNIYKCFGCGKGGDSVRFIMDHEHLSFPEAVRFLAARYRIEIEETENTAQEIEQKQVTDSLYIVNDFARDYFTDVLFNRSEGRNIGLSYFKERGYRESTIKKFQLGYATEERDEFTKKAIDKKFNIEHLRTLGLTSKSDLDFFRSRVMFTIHNVSGKVVAFAGRTLSSDKKQPKYINSPESEIYNKRAVLYGLFFAKEAIRKADECILVEGYTDVITLHQGQIENVVASSGTSLTREQIRLIKRYTPNIKIIYDGDPAGIKAALRGLDLVLESDMNVKLVLLPDGQDPDSFLAAQGTEAFPRISP
ncbi:MAG: DNA primase [Saprospiraceae bacterium]|nr:DNA primase [Saprospiraceae bacterium]